MTTRLEAGRYLEQGVLADLKSESGAQLLKISLKKFEESRLHLDLFKKKMEELRAINKKNAAHEPERSN